MWQFQSLVCSQPSRNAILLTRIPPKTSQDAETGGLCYAENMKTKITIGKPVHLPSVTGVEASPTGRQLYVWLDDGRSGMVDLSDWEGPLADRWDTEGFDHWKVDGATACWGEDRHISPDLCSDRLVEMSHEEWRSSCESVFAVQRSTI